MPEAEHVVREGPEATVKELNATVAKLDDIEKDLRKSVADLNEVGVTAARIQRFISLCVALPFLFLLLALLIGHHIGLRDGWLVLLSLGSLGLGGLLLVGLASVFGKTMLGE